MLDAPYRLTAVTAATLGLPLGPRGLAIPHRSTQQGGRGSGTLVGSLKHPPLLRNALHRPWQGSLGVSHRICKVVEGLGRAQFYCGQVEWACQAWPRVAAPSSHSIKTLLVWCLLAEVWSDASPAESDSGKGLQLLIF